MYNLKQLFDDHADFIFAKLMIAQSCVTDKQWTSVRGCLSSNYKFSVDTSTFAGALGTDVIILPAARAIISNSAKVLELFVRYDFVNGQDAGIREMLMTTKKIGWSEDFSSNLSQDITHRFSALTSTTHMLGVIDINTKSNNDIGNLVEQFDSLYKYSVKHKSLNEYLAKLKEISNE